MSRTSRIKLHELRSVLEKKDIDAILVENSDDVRYLSSFPCTFGYLLVTRGPAWFVTDTRYQLEAEKNPVISSHFSLLIQKKSGPETLKSLFRTAKPRNCIIDSENTTISRFDLLKEQVPEVSFIPVENIVRNLRLIKTAEETEKIREALAIAEKSFLGTLAFVKEGVSERSLKTELEYRFLKNGGDEAGFSTIIASGPNSATPHASVTDRKIGNHEMIIFDFGVRKNGYHSDITRTVHLGKPSPLFIRRYNAVRDTLLDAEAGIRTGLDARKADSLARKFLKKKGLVGYFTHSLGHGIGCEVHERPYLSPKGTDVLRNGMVFSVEPGIYIRNWGGIRIEDLVLLKPNGPEVLTRLDTKLLIL